jgi:hypothetical protein
VEYSEPMSLYQIRLPCTEEKHQQLEDSGNSVADSDDEESLALDGETEDPPAVEGEEEYDAGPSGKRAPAQ